MTLWWIASNSSYNNRVGGRLRIGIENSHEQGDVRSYADARPRAANGAKAVVVRGGRRTTRVSNLLRKHVGRMLGHL